MSRNSSITMIISLLVLIVLGCSISSTPAAVIPTQTEARQAPTSPSTATQAPAVIIPTQTEASQASITPSTATQSSICGWIENSSTTGVMAPKMTVSGTGQVLNLWNLDIGAIGKLNYQSPAYFRVYDPAYQSPDLLVNFSSIEQVSGCASVQTATQTSICGWIENSSTTGVMAPTMTVSGTGQVLNLWNLDVGAIGKLDYKSPANYRVYDPVYQAPDLLVNFSSIEQVSSCTSAQTATINPTQAAYVSGFSGTWDTNWGVMTCSVDGQMVKCNYTHDVGKIEAWLSQDGKTMQGTWSESPSYQPPDDGGRVTFSLSRDGNSITGYWWYGQNKAGGSWTGTRK